MEGQTFTLFSSDLTVVLRALQPQAVPRPSPLHPCTIDLTRLSPLHASPSGPLLCPLAELHFQHSCTQTYTEALLLTSNDPASFPLAPQEMKWTCSLVMPIQELEDFSYSLVLVTSEGRAAQPWRRLHVDLRDLAKWTAASGSWKVGLQLII